MPLTLTYTWRAATAADLPGIHALKTAAGLADGDPGVPALADLQRQFEDDWCKPPFDTRLALAPDGQVAAYGRVVANPTPEAGSPARATLSDTVHPAHRGAGLEGALFTWLAERGRARLAPATAASSRTLCVHVSDDLTERVAAYQHHGFKPSFSLVRMRRPLTGPLPDYPLPPGFTRRAYAPELSEALRLAQNEVFAEDPLQDQISAADWQIFYLDNSAARPDLTFVIFAGPELVAYSINRVHADEHAHLGYTTGWIHTLGTRQPWRRQGLAAHLLATSLAAFRAAGLEYATLEADAADPMGARRLYERLGFVVFRHSTEYVQDLN